VSSFRAAWLIWWCASLLLAAGCGGKDEAKEVLLIDNAPRHRQVLNEVQASTQGPLELAAQDEELSKADIAALNAAEPKVRGLVAYDPNIVGPQILLGKLLMALDRKDEAIAQLRTALAVAPQTDEPQYRALIADAQADLGILLLRSGEVEAAGDELRTAAAADPSNPKALSHHASYLLELRDYEAAHQEILKALNIDSEFQPAVRLHDFMHAAAGDQLKAHP
jgi:Flp pilus assembly protein TadD